MSKASDIDYDIEDDILPYLLFKVGSNTYGINSQFVRSIEKLEKIIHIVESEPCVRGGVIYHNKFIYLTDMRKLFGLDSQIEEFEKSAQPEKRVEDHEKWIAALEKSVFEHTEFLLADDPRQCAFGKWYYSYNTDNNVLMHQLHLIENPHKAIHDTAVLIKSLMKEGKYELAKSALNEMRATHYKTTLSIMSSLHETVRNSISEIYVVIDSDNCNKGIIVDSIVGVEYIDEILSLPEHTYNSKYTQSLGRRKSDGSVIIILNNSI